MVAIIQYRISLTINSLYYHHWLQFLLLSVKMPDLQRGHHLALLSAWRLGTSIHLLQSTRSFTTTSPSLHVLNPRWSLYLSIVLHNVSRRRLPSGAHVCAILGFWSEAILKTCLSHFNLLALTCWLIVLAPGLPLISSLLTFIGQKTFRIFLKHRSTNKKYLFVNGRKGRGFGDMRRSGRWLVGGGNPILLTSRLSW